MLNQSSFTPQRQRFMIYIILTAVTVAAGQKIILNSLISMMSSTSRKTVIQSGNLFEWFILVFWFQIFWFMEPVGLAVLHG